MERRAKLTQEDKAEMVRLRVEERLSSLEIAAIMGSNTTTVCAIVKPFPLTADERRARRAVVAAKMRRALARAGNYQGGHAWTEADDEALRKMWPAKTRKQIEAAFPGRSWVAIGKRAGDKGIRRSRAASNTRKSGKNKPDSFFVTLREIREARGITRDELAEKMGIHRVMLAHYELGEARPGWLRVRDWLDALGYDIRTVPVATAEKQRAGRIWLTDEENILRELSAQGSTVSEIVLALKRPAAEVERRLQMLGLHESERTRSVSGMTRARLS